MKKFLLLLFSAVLFLNVYAQEKAVVSSFTINEKISKSDKLDPALGRYDAYELNVDKGDRIAFEVKAKKFLPFLLLVSPSQKSFFKIPDKSKSILFDTLATEKGNWSFYVLADSNSFGKYSCTVAFANSSAMVLPKAKDICGKIKYLILHSDGEFLFLRNNGIPTKLFPGKELKADVQDCCVKLELSGSRKEYENYIKEIEKCLDGKYYSEKSGGGIKFTENVFKKKHYVLLHWNSSGEKIEIEIGRSL